MKRCFFACLIAAFALVTAQPSFAQGGGASSTGTIQGRVSDAQGAVLPGVTVTATSPSALGAQTTVSYETGNYRFPAIPPGVYTLTFELTGPAKLIGVDNGDLTSHESYKTNTRPLYLGMALALVQSTSDAGTAHLVVHAAGLPDAAVTIATAPKL